MENKKTYKEYRAEQKAIRETCNGLFVITCGVTPELKSEVEKLYGEFTELCREMTRNYFANEREFDRVWWSDGLDNVMPYYEESEVCFDVKTDDDYRTYLGKSLSWDYLMLFYYQWLTECMGYGVNAMSRGFSPCGKMTLWTQTVKGKKILDKISDLLGIPTSVTLRMLPNLGIEYTRAASNAHFAWEREHSANK